MNTPASEAAKIIANLKNTLPQIVLEKQYQLQPHLREVYTERHEKHYLEDTTFHLRYLAEAVSANEPKLFTEYIKWAKAFFKGLPVSEEDLIVNLEVLKEALSAELPEDGAIIANKYIDIGIEIFRSEQESLRTYIEDTNPLAKYASEYLSSLIEGDKKRAGELIMELQKEGTSIKDIYLNIFQVTQKETGRLWQLSKLSVAQEHFITAATQLIMSQLYPYLFSESERNKKIVIACVPGELHELGARMVADIFELEGWSSYYFGANTPTNSLIQSIEYYNPDVVAISATMIFHLSEVAQIIDSIRSTVSNKELKLMVGGYPFQIADGLWERIGADAYAHNAIDATNKALELVS